MQQTRIRRKMKLKKSKEHTESMKQMIEGMKNVHKEKLD